MIQLTRLNNHPLTVNSDLIKLVENAPDTVMTLVTGEKIVVLETTEQIMDKIVDFRRRILTGLPIQFAGNDGCRVESAKPAPVADEES